VNTELYHLVATTGDLATLPGTVIELLYLFKDTAAGADGVVKILERDPAMTANVLKMSNSAFYGSRREITNVQDALVMLGNRAVVTMAFATGMAPVLRRDLDGYGISRSRFWNHSILSASAASFAADRLGTKEIRCEAFTSGLVHDVGMLVIDPHLQNTGRTLDPVEPAFDVSDAERSVLGFDHCEAGAMLAENWGFPPVLTAGIKYHHEPQAATAHLAVVRAVAVGNLLALVMEQELDPAAHPTIAPMVTQLGLDPATVTQLCRDLAGSLDETVATAIQPDNCPA
jgi:HD-like signal output (HDOD) protein